MKFLSLSLALVLISAPAWAQIGGLGGTCAGSNTYQDGEGNCDTLDGVEDFESATDDAVLVGTGTVFDSKPLPTGCSDGSTDKLLYNSVDNTFSCGVDQGGAGSGDVSDVGDCASGACFTADGTGNAITFEGTTANSFETSLVAADPSSDRIIVLPDEGGTICVGATGAGCPAGAGDIQDVFNCSTGNCAEIAATDGDSLDFSAVTPGDPGEGIILPQTGVCSGTPDAGAICYGTTGDNLCVYDGGAWDCVPITAHTVDTTCATTNCILNGGDTINGAPITLDYGVTPGQTTEGLVLWDSDDDRFTVGNGAGVTVFYSGAHTVDTNTNAQTVCGANQYLDGDGGCADVLEEAELDSLAELNAQIADATFVTGAHTVNTNTNAQTICVTNQYLDGDGNCVDVLTEAELDSLTELNAQLSVTLVAGAHTVDTDTNTNAETECAANEYLDGTGACVDVLTEAELDSLAELNAQLGTSIPGTAHTVDTDTNTNAQTLCAANEYLDGTGACVDVLEEDELDSLAELNAQLGTSIVTGAHTVDVNTNAQTICGAGLYLDGDGSCPDLIGEDELNSLAELNAQIGETLVTGAHTVDTDTTCATVNCILNGGDTINGAPITLDYGVTPGQTTEGLVLWDSDDDRFTVGNGVGTTVFYSGAHTVDTNTNTNAQTICATGEYLDGNGDCADVLEEDELDSLAELNAQIGDATFVTGAHTVDTDTDTNAQTICATGEYLDGNGDCADVLEEDELDSLAELNAQIGDATFVTGAHTVDTDTTCQTAGVECTLDGNDALNLTSIILDWSATATPTIEGDVLWDSNDDRLAIGNGVGTTVFYSGDHTVSSGITHNSTTGGTATSAHHVKAVSSDITHASTTGGTATSAHHVKAVSGDITHASTTGGTLTSAHHVKTVSGDISHDSITGVSVSDHHTKTASGDISHDSITGVSASDHHAQVTALPHSAITSVGTDNHHAKAVSSDITHASTTGGTLTSAHHVKTVSGDISHDSITGVSVSDHHVKAVDTTCQTTGVECTLDGNDALNLTSIVLDWSAVPAPTVEGDVLWDSNDDRIAIGNGVGTTVFYPGAHVVSSAIVHSLTNGGQLPDAHHTQTVEGSCTDCINTGQLDDGADSPATGECLKVATDTTAIEYGSCAATADTTCATAGVNCTLDGTDAINGTPITLDFAASPTPTTRGQVIWDSVADRLAIGDGVGTQVFHSGAHTVDTDTNTNCGSAGVNCALSTGDIVLQSTIYLERGTVVPAPTTVGLMVWDDTNDRLMIGDGVITRDFYPGPHDDTKCFYVEDPVTNERFDSIWRPTRAATITEFWCESDGDNVGVSLEVDDGVPNSVRPAELACTSAGVESGTLTGDTTLAIDQRLDLKLGTVGGAPAVSRLSVCWTYSYD